MGEEVEVKMVKRKATSLERRVEVDLAGMERHHVVVARNICRSRFRIYSSAASD